MPADSSMVGIKREAIELPNIGNGKQAYLSHFQCLLLCLPRSNICLVQCSVSSHSSCLLQLSPQLILYLHPEQLRPVKRRGQHLIQW